MEKRLMADIEVNPNILAMEYAVRGPIPKRAAELRRQGRTTIACNIGNPQALGQSPITFYRQVLGLVEDRARIVRERRLRATMPGDPDLVPEYALDYAESFLSRMQTGMGAYSDSNGPRFIREAVAAFINRRDGFDPAGRLGSDPDGIFLTNGASEAARYIIDLLVTGPNDGVMIPIPQYPLYSATITRAGGAQVNYDLDEDAGWTLSRPLLEKSISSATKKGIAVKAIVVINPGNPTGAVLDEATVRDVIAFAADHGLVLIADEVYQENTYGAPFVSFARVMGDQPVPLFSLHSISKGYVGECGHRGGYLEVRNPPRAAGSGVPITDIILKQASVCLCSNTVGQLLTYLMVNPPGEGSEPHGLFLRERETILRDLEAKAAMIRKAFDSMDGVECFGRTGAMYLFPRLNRLPAGTDDFDYCMALLEETGLCTVNGAGFGQKKGTHHLRIAFLPPKDLLEKVLPEWIRFHNRYVGR